MCEIRLFLTPFWKTVFGRGLAVSSTKLIVHDNALMRAFERPISVPLNAARFGLCPACQGVRPGDGPPAERLPIPG